MVTLEAYDENSQTRACQKLLAAVVAVAVNDTCVEPFRATSKDKTLFIRKDTVTAFRFLFSKEVSGLDSYALWLDFNPDNFRRKLLDAMWDESVDTVAGKDSQQRRNFRYNYKLWRKLPHTELTEEDEDDRLVRGSIKIEITR